MNREPRIGERVRFAGPYYSCTGTVTRVYKPRTISGRGFLKIDFWHAFVTVDAIPDGWPYQTNEFAPMVTDIEPLEVQ